MYDKNYLQVYKRSSAIDMTDHMNITTIKLLSIHSVFAVVKELTIQPNSDKEVVTLYLSHHFIFLLEEIEGTCTQLTVISLFCMQFNS